MEEILASIRRIISEDESPIGEGDPPAAEAAEPAPPEPEPEGVAEAAAPPPEPEPEPEPEPLAAPPPEPAALAPPAEDEDDDDLELTQKIETHGDLDVLAPSEPEPAPLPMATLVSEQVAAVTAASFDKLSATIAMPAAGRTLEDVVREMLRPMLQQWLDDNLPGIVQEAVQSEVDRISRSRVR